VTRPTKTYPKNTRIPRHRSRHRTEIVRTFRVSGSRWPLRKCARARTDRSRQFVFTISRSVKFRWRVHKTFVRSNFQRPTKWNLPTVIETLLRIGNTAERPRNRPFRSLVTIIRNPRLEISTTTKTIRTYFSFPYTRAYSTSENSFRLWNRFRRRNSEYCDPLITGRRVFSLTAGEYLKEKYEGAIEVRATRRGRLQIRDPRFSLPTSSDLVYIDDSPNYCIRNVTAGSIGKCRVNTRGRVYVRVFERKLLRTVEKDIRCGGGRPIIFPTVPLING